MESANLHRQHDQLQDQFVGSSSLTTTTPSSYAEAGSTHAWTQTITQNSGNSSPNYNGVVFNPRQKYESPVSSVNSTMIQDLGFQHWHNNAGSFNSLSAYHDLQLSKIKEELSSDSFPKFTEMLNSPSSTIEDPLPSSSSNFNSEKLLKTISPGFPRHGHDQFSPREISSSHHNGSSFGSAIPSGESFSQIYPSINISNLNQPSSPLISGSFDMNLQGLDLLTSTRFSGSFAQPSDDPLAMFNKDSLSFGLDRMQLASQRPSCRPNKISSTNEMTEAKRPNNSLMEPKATQAAAPKKSRLESRVSCPPLKARKEKLGDRIAALQQLVAPFGKTDTASVLMEAIGYIKFLQNQVETLSIPYMKSSGNKTSRSIQAAASNLGDIEEPKRDLRSRGLCLVPLSCMSYVTSDGGGGGIWPPPNFGGGT
ncbi:PREDICTED: transcription factor bHLH110-like isoform X2 [Populus euphratica]|uniref:Transcription factor bHLH110-like isoform X2 n=1 Tax=Populus euphratica TaxID=75702 RepID=A0AAJ6UG54_POPEU|nr:PREDICTED: transcription factor bHLH110-like isoform X2 [Populus euphratica]